VSRPPPNLSRLQVREVDAATAPVLASAMGTEGDLVGARMARGCRSFAAWIDGGIAGYGWLSTRPEWIGELQLEIAPRPGEGYIWNCFTLPEHRRKGIFHALLIGIPVVMRSEGMSRSWIGSVAIPAENAFGSAGFAPALQFTAITRADLIWLNVRQAVDGNPSLSTEACEVLRVRPGSFLRTTHTRRH
jgi:GNAT superfamily N-acetyltransferase